MASKSLAHSCQPTYGDVRGDIHSEVLADVYGDVCGDIHGHIHARVHVHVNGDVYGHVYGVVHGDVYGDVHGCVFGRVFGRVDGLVLGNTSVAKIQTDSTDFAITQTKEDTPDAPVLCPQKVSCLDKVTDNSARSVMEMDSLMKAGPPVKMVTNPTPISNVQFTGTSDSPITTRVISVTSLYQNTESSKEPFARELACIKIDLRGACSDSNGNFYEPGDHIGIVPGNSALLVNKLLKRLNVPEPDAAICLTTFDEHCGLESVLRSAVERRGPSLTARDLFTLHVDIMGPVTMSILEFFAGFASDTQQAAELSKLAYDSTAYNKWTGKYYAGLFDVLMHFSSVSVTVEDLLNFCEPIQPRFYSISSSQRAVGPEVHLTVARHIIPAEQNRTLRKCHRGSTPAVGLCSSFLLSCCAGDQVRAFIRPCKCFRLPADKSATVVMVCAGSGIAPFRSFWQEREAGPNLHLLAGCRTGAEEAYTQEISSCVGGSYHPVFSREGGDQRYAQDKVADLLDAVILSSRNDTANVPDLLSATRNMRMFVCGSTQLATGVLESFIRALQASRVACNLPACSSEYAEGIVNLMKAEGRWNEDLYDHEAKPICVSP